MSAWVCPTCGKLNLGDPCIICEQDAPDSLRPPLAVRTVGQHRWEWQHAYTWHLDPETFQVIESCECGKIHQVWSMDD